MGRCQSLRVNDARGRLALGPVGEVMSSRHVGSEREQGSRVALPAPAAPRSALPSEASGGQRLGWSGVEDPQLLWRLLLCSLNPWELQK